MSDIVTINTNGLDEAIRCAICENTMKTDNGCDGYCRYDKSTFEKVKEAVNGCIVERPHGNWEHLKEHITELRDANGYATQYGTCQFILNLMKVIEREGEAE